MSLSVPVIDISRLKGGEGPAKDEIVSKIFSACSTIGFFYVVGHGISPVIIDGAFEQSRIFFEQPLEIKRRTPANSVYHGFTEMRHDELWGTRKIAPYETFAFGTPVSAAELDALPSGSFIGPNVWPDLPSFKKTMTKYFDAVTASAQAVLGAMALGLDMKEDFFASRFQRRSSVCTMLHYPALPKMRDIDLVSSTPHTDADCITFLAQDSNGGLEVQRRDTAEWIPVPPLPGSFVCNLGDLMARWSDDRFTSTMHRVVNRSGRTRYSIATFNNPDPEAEVDPRQMGFDSGKYPSITAGEYMNEYMRQIYAANKAVGV